VHLTSEQLEIILNGCRLNERRAQKELYRNYYSYAMSIALRYSSNYDNAIEMANDGFLKIYRSLKNFVPLYDNTVASFTAWFKKLMVNACIDHIRKYNKKEMMASVDTEQVVIADERQTAEQMLQHKEIIKCIQQLSPAYKAVFNLYVIEGFSHAEIADKLNISENTSKSNLHKARQSLQQLLKKSNIINYERTL
jgi:RNA polymerase sigma factor (sigma-70 family)